MEFERHLDTLKLRVRVKAARDLSEVAEGLRIVASAYMRRLLLCLSNPSPGSDEASHILPLNARADADEHDHEPSDDSIIGLDEIPSAVRIPSAAREQCRK